jgi:hypothetical protein
MRLTTASSATDKNEWSYTSILLVCLHGKYGDNFVFTFTVFNACSIILTLLRDRHSCVVWHSADLSLPSPPPPHYIRYARVGCPVCVRGLPLPNLIWFMAYPDGALLLHSTVPPGRRQAKDSTLRRQSLPSRFQCFMAPLCYSLPLYTLDCWQHNKVKHKGRGQTCSKITRGFYRDVMKEYRNHGRKSSTQHWPSTKCNE